MSASLFCGYEKTLFPSIESVSQTFWVVSKWPKCVDYVENTCMLKILTCEHFCWIIQNDSRPFSVLYIVTHFKCSLLMNINVDMKLSHISFNALSYVVWYHLQNFICMLKFGCECGMNFHENAISLVADNLRAPEDQVEYLQKNRIFPTSFNCPACDIGCERVQWSLKVVISVYP